jgi:hypothetical protein
MAVCGDLCNRFSRKSIHFVRFPNPRLIRNQQVDGSNPPASSHKENTAKQSCFLCFWVCAIFRRSQNSPRITAKPLIFYLLLDAVKFTRRLKSPRIRNRFGVSLFLEEGYLPDLGLSVVEV